MAYEKRNNSILRRSLALVLCCCLLLCVAVPRARAADPVTLAVSGTILVTSILVALGFMDATNAGQAFSNMVEDIVNSGIDLGWLTPQGLVEVLTSSYEDVAYVDTAFVDFVNTEAINSGYYLDASFSYTAPILEDGQVVQMSTYGVYSYINNVACAVDSAFAEWWNANATNYVTNYIRNSPYCSVQFNSSGIVYLQGIVGSPEFRYEIDNIGSTNSPRWKVVPVYDGEVTTVPRTFSITRDGNGGFIFNSIETWAGLNTINYCVDADSTADLDSPSGITVSTLGTTTINDFAFNAPATIPDVGVSVTTLFPDWGAKEIEGTLPIYCPGTEAEVLDATQEEAQVIQFPSGDNNNNNDDDPDYTPNFKVLERILNLSTAGIVAKFLDLFDLLSEWFQRVIDSIVELGQNTVDKLSTISTQINSGFNNLFNQFLVPIRAAVGSIKTWTDNFFSNLATSLETALSSVKDAINNAWWQINLQIAPLYDYLSDIYNELVNGVSVAVFSIWDSLTRIDTWVETFFETLVENWHDFWDGLISKVSTLTDVVSDHLANFWENLQAKLQPLLDPIIEAIEQLPKGARDWKEKFKRFLADGFGFTNIWHYVTAWIGCISGFVGQILAIWSKLPYCMVVPVYACVTLTIVFGMYRRFIR